MDILVSYLQTRKSYQKLFYDIVCILDQTMAEKRLSVKYAVTLTTSGRFKDKTSEDQFDEICDYFYQDVFWVLAHIKLSLIAELHKDKSSVHVHGVIQFDMDHVPSKYLYYPCRLVHDHLKKSKIWGFSCFKQIEDENYWVQTYIKKDLQDTNRIINRFPVIKDDFDYFKEELGKFL